MALFISQFQLSTSTSIYLTGLFIVLLVTFTLFIYKRTNPIVSPFLRALLAVLRSIALLLVLIVLLETVLLFIQQKRNPPIVAVALDTSASMQLSDNKGERDAQLRRLLESGILSEGKSDYVFKYYTFANDAAPLTPADAESLRFLGDKTNLWKSLQSIIADHLDQNLTNIVLISDGNYNAGGNPARWAEELDVPVHTIALGSAEPVTDLAVQSVDANPFTYVGQTTPISLSLRNSGYENINVPVRLQVDEKIVDEKPIRLKSSISDETVQLNFQPEKDGRQKLTISVAGQADEYTLQNNQQTLYIDVLKSKVNLLLIAGRLSPDITFLKKALNTERYQIQELVQKRAGEFYQRQPTVEELASFDQFIFYDFPTPGSNRLFLQHLKHTLERTRQPLLFIAGPSVSMPELKRFQDYLPIRSLNPKRQEVLVTPQLTPVGTTHPIMTLSEDGAFSQTLWRELPPVFSQFDVIDLSPGSQVLAYARSAATPNTHPLFSLYTQGTYKSAGIYAYELWRWDFMMKGIDHSNDFFQILMTNLIRWLEIQQRDKRLHVEMDKNTYNYGDPIQMKISAFDENLNPLTNATVTVNVQHRSKTTQTIAQSDGQGNFNTNLQATEPGDYKAVVSAQMGDTVLATETILFSVGEYSAELSDLKAQFSTLEGLSRVTGGRFFKVDSLDQFSNAISGEPTTTTIHKEYELWNHHLILLSIFVVLALEWLIRKRRGMV